jgi:hypothetical protein
MIKHYFATDGNWGDASGMAIVKTDHWTERIWEVMEDQSDWRMPEMAEHFDRGVHSPADKNTDVCDICETTRKERESNV